MAFAYDPNTERLEVHSKGLVNAWGQQEDLAGQTFLTSGADGTGVHWAFPGAAFPPSEGARRLVGSISPGSYPKFSGLELVNSPVFGPEWQGNAITCDFRAHRIVRFGFNDFSTDAAPKSGYVTKELPDVVRTSDVAFRPITLKMGPDGALYVADWTNPIINHGEVDFRDPRRDKISGRIWRILPENAKPLAWQPLLGQPVSVLLAELTSPSRWTFEQSRRELAKLPVADPRPADRPAMLFPSTVQTPTEAPPSPLQIVEAMLFVGGPPLTADKVCSAVRGLTADRVRELIDEGYGLARKILLEKSEEFERLAKGLLEYETLTGDEIRKVIAGQPLDSGTDGGAPPSGDALSVNDTMVSSAAALSVASARQR